MDEDELVLRLVEARDRGQGMIARELIGRFIWGRYNMLIAIARMHLSATSPEEADDVVQEALVSALKGDFKGRSTGELINYLKRIIHRRAADANRRKVPTPVSEMIVDGERVDGLANHSVDGDPAEFIGLADAAQRILDSLADTHRMIVGVYLRERLPASEICERLSTQGITVSENNVHQVIRRYRQQVKIELGFPEESRGQG